MCKRKLLSNMNKLPSDFRYQLSDSEMAEVVANCDHLKNLKFSRTHDHQRQAEKPHS